ncbi:MAG: UPF0158 family protein [Polyangiaceae bacterium]|nr:UPF0158 family protein [Polyangiaceae bacterium]
MSSSLPGQSPMREVPVDWDALEDAFENNAPEVHSYLHLETGEVLRVVDGIADPEMHARIAGDNNYLRVEAVSSREQYRWMERFIPTVLDEGLRQMLATAIDGKGAFRRFKDALVAHVEERERWFAFRSERLRVFLEAWLSAHSVVAVPRLVAEPSAAAPFKDTSSVSQAELDGRRGRTLEALRLQLAEIVQKMGVRDLEKVTTFAEFTRARRVARGYAHRTSGGGPSADGSEPPSSRGGSDGDSQ